MPRTFADNKITKSNLEDLYWPARSERNGHKDNVSILCERRIGLTRLLHVLLE